MNTVGSTVVVDLRKKAVVPPRSMWPPFQPIGQTKQRAMEPQLCSSPLMQLDYPPH